LRPRWDDPSLPVPYPSGYIDKATGEQQLVDRCPPEVRAVFHEHGFQAGFAAFHQWRANRSRGGRHVMTRPLAELFTRS
jgi:hypothetical protein